MRTLSTDALAAVNTQKGQKPLVLLEIQWVESAGIYKYADKDIDDYVGRILSISSLDEIIKTSGGSNSGQVSVVLDDIDGSLKNIMDTHDIHKRPCWIYQFFEGLSTVDDKFLLMKGEINSPVVWDEGARQLSFQVVSQIESTEVGFSIEEGQFPLLPIDLVGKAWPLAFGSVVNVPALKITSPREGILADGFGIHDYTLRRRIQLADAICCPNNSIIGYNTLFGTTPSTLGVIPTNPNTGQPADVTAIYGAFGSLPFGNQVIDPGSLSPGTNNSVLNGTSSGTGTGVSQTPIYGPDPNCISNRCDVINQLNFDLANQKRFEFATIKIFGGSQFEQGKTITLAIGGAYVIGKFSGETFTVSQYIHRDAVDNKTAFRAPTTTEKNFILNQDQNRGSVLTGFGSENPADVTAAFLGVLNAGPGTIPNLCSTAAFIPPSDCQSISIKSLNDYPTSSFQWVNAGAKVTYAFDEEIVYIANILPSTVKCVTAYRTLDNGQRLLLVVPTDYYTVRTTNYTGYNVVEVVMTRALSLQGDGWEDDIFVTMDSSVGRNTVDIMQWLIETYTSFGVDAASFAAVHAAIDNYPSDFALLDRKNILQVLDEISMQARCALFLRDDTFFIKYLSILPTSVDEITEDHVIQNSLKITQSRTEDLVTKMVVTWNDDYALASKLLIVRNNIEKYGTIEQTFDFYIYNNYALVEKSAIFWLIRKSNTWRILTLSTPLIKLPLESFDDIDINLSDVGAGDILSQVTTAVYNSDSNQIDFEIWTSSLAGTTSQYPWAYPGSVSSDQLWPPDLVAQGPGFSVVAPVGHPLSSTTFPENVPDDITAPNFTISNCEGPPTPELNFCCTTDTQAQPSEFCQTQAAKRTDDGNDIKPDPRTVINCPGAVNLGKDPVLAQVEPKFKAIQQLAQRAMQTAASAKDAALSAGGGAGGAGGAGGQNEDDQKRRTDSFDRLPKQQTNNPVDPTKTATCTTTITISWFPLMGLHIGGQYICVPAGATRTETHTFGGCKDAEQPGPNGPVAGAAQGMIDLLISKGMNPTTFELCSGGYDNSPCCHATVQVVSPNCALCDKGASDGLWMKVDKLGQSGEPKKYSSIFEDSGNTAEGGNGTGMGDRGDAGLGGGQGDTTLGIDAS